MSPDPRYFSSAALVAGLSSVAREAVNCRPYLGLTVQEPRKFHGRPGEDLGLVDDNGLLRVGVVERQDAQDRPAGISIVKGDAVHDPPKALGDDAALILNGWLHRKR